MKDPEVEGQEQFQVLDHHGPRHEVPVEQQPLHILRHEVGGTDAHRCETIAALLGVRRVFALPKKVEQRCGLYVVQRFAVQLTRDLVEPLKEEALEVLNRVRPSVATRMVQHLIQVLCCTVVA